MPERNTGQTKSQRIWQRPKNRLEVFSYNGKTVLFDVAHNEPGMEQLKKVLQEKYPGKKISAIMGFSKKREVGVLLSAIEKALDSIFLISTDHYKLQSIEQMKEQIPNHFLSKIAFSEKISETIEKALQNADLLVVTGSFYIMKDVRKAIGVQEEKDSSILDFA